MRTSGSDRGAERRLSPLPDPRPSRTELSVLTRQCLDRRIPDKDTLTSEVTAWMHDRNVKQADIDWRFTTADARIKLKRLYPAILP